MLHSGRRFNDYEPVTRSTRRSSALAADEADAEVWPERAARTIVEDVLLCYVPSQLSVEGTLTARPREVNLILLLCLAGLLSIPLALEPDEAWATFSDTFIRCVFIFIIMVNAVRTELRLKSLIVLSLIVGCWLSLSAVNDYRLGLMTVEGYRVAGRGTGIFGNSNDMALFLVTMVPLAIALLFGTRGVVRKILYGAAAALMIAAITLTFSRGGFLGLLVSLGVLSWKLGRRHRMTILLLTVVLVIFFLLVAPGNYSLRLASIFIPSLDPVGSSSMRQQLLWRSILVAIRHPLFGIGMGNFHIVSFDELVSHNAYTQVAAEMGAAALMLYTMFIVHPLRRLRQIERETFEARSHSHFYYLSIGLQATLVGYMVSSFFVSVAYLWYVYYLVAYAVCFRRLYEAGTGTMVVLEKQKVKERLKAERRLARLAASEGLGAKVAT
jgi:O-antigen ligase